MHQGTPAVGAGMYRTVNDVVSYKTREFVLFYSTYNLANAACTSIDVARTFREVVLGVVVGLQRGNCRLITQLSTIPRRLVSPRLLLITLVCTTDR